MKLVASKGLGLAPLGGCGLMSVFSVVDQNSHGDLRQEYQGIAASTMGAAAADGGQAVYEEGTGPGPRSLFATTHWTVVLSAGDTAAPAGQAALEELCRSYWYPLYT